MACEKTFSVMHHVIQRTISYAHGKKSEDLFVQISPDNNEELRERKPPPTALLLAPEQPGNHQSLIIAEKEQILSCWTFSYIKIYWFLHEKTCIKHDYSKAFKYFFLFN